MNTTNSTKKAREVSNFWLYYLVHKLATSRSFSVLHKVVEIIFNGGCQDKKNSGNISL